MEGRESGSGFVCIAAFVGAFVIGFSAELVRLFSHLKVGAIVACIVRDSS
jgi:hypothetical protein